MTEQEILEKKIEITTSLVNQLIEKGESVTEEYADWVNRAYELRELGAAGLQLYHQLSQMDGFAYDSYQTSVNFRSALRNQRNNVDGNADDNHARSRTLQSFFYLCRDKGLQVPQIEGVSVHARQSNSGYEMEAIDPEKADSIGSEQLLASSAYDSMFHRSLISNGYLKEEQWQNAKEMYHLGGTRDDKVVFWQIDHKGRVRDGKVMAYNSDCHRQKKPSGTLKPSGTPVTWMSVILKFKKQDEDGNPILPRDWKGCHCLFGEHLLSSSGGEATVALVESEKTAVVMSQIAPWAIWMATGGLQWLSAESFQHLKGRRIIVFPDTDLKGSTFKKWQQICQKAEKLIHQHITICDILEKNASQKQKEQKIDILDWISEK